MLFKLCIIVLSIGGFALSAYIGRQKRSHKQMVCPLDSDCESVVTSEFSHFFGIPLEYIGMAYYGALALAYGAFALSADIHTPFVAFILLVLTTVALLFSGYLTSIQAFTLKEWCTWCLTSAALTAAIFLLSFWSLPVPTLVLFAMHAPILAAFHSLGLALGIGAIIIAVLLLFRFLKDLRINETEAGILRIVNQFVWVSLGVVAVTGIGLYAPYINALGNNPIFNLRFVAFIGLLASAGSLDFLLVPHLVRVSLGVEKRPESDLRILRRAAFIVALISVVSWVVVYGIGYLTPLYISFFSLFTGYVGILVGAVIAAVVIEKHSFSATEKNAL